MTDHESVSMPQSAASISRASETARHALPENRSVAFGSLLAPLRLVRLLVGDDRSAQRVLTQRVLTMGAA